MTRVLRAAGLAAVAVGAAYPVLLRPTCLTWGASRSEACRPMPGDELLPEPDMLTTRAVGVTAPPAAIWPWLVQMGTGRGGAYTYDWIENLFGLDMHSADEILPQFQDLRVGDVLPMGREGPGMRVAVLEPERTLAFQSEDHAWVWIFGLYAWAGGTRLVSRNRIRAARPMLGLPMLGRLVNSLVMEPGSLIMERKMLLGIKERAERTAVPG
jgi:hypothetical protein